MTANAETLFLDFSGRKLLQLAGRIGVCLGKLTPEQVWARGGENENAVGNLVLHLCGNVRQWIISGVGGEPDRRRRDAEFAAREGLSPAELRAALEETVAAAARVIGTLPPGRLTETAAIQAYKVTMLEAIYHVVEHFAQHTGQILFATKQMSGEDLGFYRHLNRPSPHEEKTP